MPEGAELGGIVGEYPFAASYTSETSWQEFKPSDRAMPVAAVPVANSMTASFDDDAFQDGPLHLELPSHVLFEPLGLRWDGAGGYRTRDGRPAFLDPSMNDSGPATLLAAPAVLEFLAERDLTVIWTMLGEKRIMLDHGAPDTTFNQVALLKPDGKLLVSAMRFDPTAVAEE
ncbi:MAG: hypothetical protein ABMA64_03315 [Myxococcota bacterium]